MSVHGKRRQSYTQGWKLYAIECAGHHAQGSLVGAGLVMGSPSVIAAACLWTVLYIAYQGLSVIRKKDSAGLDVQDFMVGAGVGLAVGLTWELLT